MDAMIILIIVLYTMSKKPPRVMADEKKRKCLREQLKVLTASTPDMTFTELYASTSDYNG